ncbi:hypothetical protein K7G98_29555, partial [Saccharothrix sp. MB29]|nr:hypothetical protein [Saccharothrix sp. MB29]
IVRHGRTGAFTFNLAAIKNHSVSAAATVLQRLEHRYDERADDVVEALTTTSDPAVDDVFSRAVSFDVRRMAARRRADREALAARLDDSLGAIRDALGAPVDDSALRFAVNTTATEMLRTCPSHRVTSGHSSGSTTRWAARVTRPGLAQPGR